MEIDKEKQLIKFEAFKVLIVCGIIAGTSIFLSSKNHKKANYILQDIKFYSSKDTVGIIKNGNELIPFYYEEYNSSEMNYNYYFLENGEYIGSEHTNDYIEVILDESERILYSPNTQVIFLGDSYLDFDIDYEVITGFGEKTYQKYADNYLENVATFDRSLINAYELESLITDEKKTVIGYMVSNTQIFNFETYRVEDYSGWNVNCILDGNTLEQDSFMYNEVLDLLEQYKCDTLALELK